MSNDNSYMGVPQVSSYMGLPQASSYMGVSEVPQAPSSQFHAQDEMGNLNYGYKNINSAKVTTALQSTIPTYTPLEYTSVQ